MVEKMEVVTRVPEQYQYLFWEDHSSGEEQAFDFCLAHELRKRVSRHVVSNLSCTFYTGTLHWRLISGELPLRNL